MLTDPEDRAARGLRRYLKLVADALDLTGDPYTIDLDPPMSAYLALDGRLPTRPDRDLALLWLARQGWAAALETGCGEDLIIVRWLGGDVLPAPRVVARFAESLLAGHSPGQTHPPDDRDSTDLPARLAAYAPAPTQQQDSNSCSAARLSVTPAAPGRRQRPSPGEGHLGASPGRCSTSPLRWGR